MRIVIDGKILLRKITGIERYARETLNELDKLITPGEYMLIVPADCEDKQIPVYKNIKVYKLKGFKNLTLWEQISLPAFAKKQNAVIINFDFTSCFFSPGISTIHDMSFRANKKFFINNIKQRIVCWKLELYCWVSIRSNNLIFTVSEFQKAEIIKYYGVEPERIVVAGNGWQHFERIKEDNSVLEEYGLKEKSFFFSLSSNTPNKNFKWVYEAAKFNKEDTFVIVGGKTSISPDDLKTEKNIIYLGYQSDERVKSLYRNCKAFLFPSYYEGFGIPPLEALSVGAPIIISRASCLPEVYGDSAYYIDPNNPKVDLDALLKVNATHAETILQRHSWKKVAYVWREKLQQLG